MCVKQSPVVIPVNPLSGLHAELNGYSPQTTTTKTTSYFIFCTLIRSAGALSCLPHILVITTRPHPLPPIITTAAAASPIPLVILSSVHRSHHPSPLSNVCVYVRVSRSREAGVSGDQNQYFLYPMNGKMGKQATIRECRSSGNIISFVV